MCGLFTEGGATLLHVPPSCPKQDKRSRKGRKTGKTRKNQGITLHTCSYACQVPKMWEMDRCHVYQRITIGLKDFLQSQFDIVTTVT